MSLVLPSVWSFCRTLVGPSERLFTEPIMSRNRQSGSTISSSGHGQKTLLDHFGLGPILMVPTSLEDHSCPLTMYISLEIVSDWNKTGPTPLPSVPVRAGIRVP